LYVSQCQMSEAVDVYELVKYVTITGRLIPSSVEDYMKLVSLAYVFRRAVLYATRMIANGVDVNTILLENSEEC